MTIVGRASERPATTIRVEDGFNLNSGITLFFADLTHAERWARDVLGQVEVLKCESANDQPKPERLLAQGCDRCGDRRPEAGVAPFTGCTECGSVPLCVECTKLHAAEIAAPSSAAVQPAGEVVESAVDTSPANPGFVCPEAEYHGSPFRYCPVKGCGWREGGAA